MPNHYRLVVDGKSTGRLTRSRTYPGRNLREIIGGMKKFTGFLPTVFINKFVDVGDGISQWTADPVAERHAAIHTPGGLLLNLLGCKRQVKCPEVVNAFLDGSVPDIPAYIF